MAFGYQGYATNTNSDTTTWGSFYFNVPYPQYRVYADPLATPTVSLGRRRVAQVELERCRSASPAVLLKPTGRTAPTVAPRRTVVARGHVSWYRQGGRRPL